MISTDICVLYQMQEKHIQEAIKRSLNAQANPSDYAIPTPNFRVVAEPDEPPFERKITYISYASTRLPLLSGVITYQLTLRFHQPQPKRSWTLRSNMTWAIATANGSKNTTRLAQSELPPEQCLLNSQ